MRSVSILTGFLGSGKTTLLNKLLARQVLPRVAILVNEFGRIGIDHDLLRFSKERVAVLANGCICCAVREDVEEAVRLLVGQEEGGEIGPFEHLLVETSGMADPAQLIRTFAASPVLASRFQLNCVAVAVDSVRGTDVFDNFVEALRQVALADLVVLTKSDLVTEADSLIALRERIKAMNADARICVTRNGELDDDLARVFLGGTSGVHDMLRSGRFGPLEALSGWNGYRHRSSIRTFSVQLEGALDWTAFALWLSWLLHRHGSKILRVKGILWVKDCAGPVVLHTVQHMVYPPEHLDAWSDGSARSRLVFIVEDLDPGLIQRSMEAFRRLLDLPESVATKWARFRAIGAGTSVNGRPVRRPSVPRWMR